MDISLRLKTVASFVSPYRMIVDIGTDHCLVPIYLLSAKKIDFAIATDIHEGPLKEAQKNLISYGIEKGVELRRASGLEAVNQDEPCDVVIVSGMGGMLIRDILKTGKNRLTNNKRLILQPNKDEPAVRRYLSETGYEIIDETVVKDELKFYEIIVAEKRSELFSLTETEIRFGPVLLKKRSPAFIEKWEQTLKKRIAKLPEIPKNIESNRLFSDEIAKIEELLHK